MEARSLFRGRGFLWWLLTVCRYKVSPPRLWNPRAPSGSSLEGSRNFNLVPGSSFPRVGQLSLPPNFEFHHALSFVNIVQRLIRFEKFSLLSTFDRIDNSTNQFHSPFRAHFVPTSVVSRIFVSQLLSDDLRTDRKVAGRGYKWCKLEPRQ